MSSVLASRCDMALAAQRRKPRTLYMNRLIAVRARAPEADFVTCLRICSSSLWGGPPGPSGLSRARSLIGCGRGLARAALERRPARSTAQRKRYMMCLAPVDTAQKEDSGVASGADGLGDRPALRAGRGDIGLRASRRASTSEGYFLANRQLRWPVIGASLFASNISAEHFVGLAAAALPSHGNWRLRVDGRVLLAPLILLFPAVLCPQPDLHGA